MSSYLRQAISRINIHRGKKLNSIAKKKDDIAKHLEAGNEVNAKIWAETLINEEGMIPCFDIISILCDQLNGRLKTIEKFGPSKDMDQNFRTLVYAAPRMEIDELMKVRHNLEKLLGKEFILAADTDEEALNKVVAANINIRIPEEGEKVKRLIDIARERNIDYKPSSESVASLRDYCDRKGLENPLGKGQSHHVIVDNLIPPPYNPSMGMDMGHQMPPPVNFGAGMPQYMPNQGMMMQPGPVYVQQPPPMMPPPGQFIQPSQPQFIQPPVIGAPIIDQNSGYNFFQPGPGGNFSNEQHEPPVIPSQGQPMYPMNRGYTLYDPNHGAGDQPQQQQEGGLNSIDDFQAKLDALKKL